MATESNDAREVASREVAYDADGLTMRSRAFWPSASPGPYSAILVFPEAFGLTEHMHRRARLLAQAGYIALACDVHGGGRIISDRDERHAALGPLLQDSSRMRARALGALSALAAQPEADSVRMAAVGFCFGGTMALELACSGAPIAATIGFHCGLSAVSIKDVSAITGSILICLGDDDPSISATEREIFAAALRKTRIDWQMHVYGGVVHAFTNPEADALGLPHFARYDPKADARSRAAMLSLLSETLHRPGSVCASCEVSVSGPPPTACLRS